MGLAFTLALHDVALAWVLVLVLLVRAIAVVLRFAPSRVSIKFAFY